MHRKSVGRVAEAIGGTLERGSASAQFTAITTDSREDCAGKFFVPLTGEKFDGHSFIVDVARRGAVGCVASRSITGRLPEGFAVIRVADTTVAYQAIASDSRRRFRGPVIAVTGSCGKTTTKNIIRAVIGHKWRVVATEKNENNDIGVPRTLLRINKSTEAVVLEFGMRGTGEIARLAAVAMPDIMVITNIEKTHIGRLGSEEAIASAKGELIANASPSNPVFLNADNSWTPWLMRNTRGRVSTFGINKGAIRATNIKVDFEGTSFNVAGDKEKWSVRMPLIGRANVYNALAAISIALELEMKPEDIAEALSRCDLAQGRLNATRTSGGSVVIDDTYNSNPSSLRYALELISDLPWKGRRVAVLGDMLELGEFSKEEHFNIGRLHIMDRCDVLMTIGKEAFNISEGALDTGMESDMVLHFANFSLLKRRAGMLFLPGDLILVKGSRGMKMEQVVHLLLSGGRV